MQGSGYQIASATSCQIWCATDLGVRELEAVRCADDDDAVVAADDLPLPQLGQRRQRHA